MPSICFYFQVHQPKRLRKYTIFDINHSHFYEDDETNYKIMRKVGDKCYLPTNYLLLDLIRKHQGRFRVSFSISGVAIEQMKLYYPEVLDSFKELARTGCVEILCETYYHSLAFLYSRTEFIKQIEKQRHLIQTEFGVDPKTYRNTELIYNNEIAYIAESLGFNTILAEGIEKILDWKSPNFVYRPVNCDQIKLLLKNYRLSDDIAFRFSNHQWGEFPLTAEKFASWVHALDGNANNIDLFMDYETFGEHQWKETGIFEFLKVLPDKIFQHPSFSFNTPSEVSSMYPVMDVIDAPYYISWADTERDLTAWKGNYLQEDSFEALYALEDKVYKSNNENIISTWQALQTSDHFYYMCTKWFADGDVHKYFNPYGSPYEAYINYQNVLRDFEKTLDARVLV